MERVQFSLRYLFLLMTAVAVVGACYSYLREVGFLFSALTCLGFHEGIRHLRSGRNGGRLSDKLFGVAFLGLGLISVSVLFYVAWNRASYVP